MITYWQDGTMSDFERHLHPSDGFGIQMIPDGIDEFIYPGDRIIRLIDSAIVNLIDSSVVRIFDDLERYYWESELIPRFITEAGLDVESEISAQEFKQILESLEHEKPCATTKESSLNDIVTILSALRKCGIEIYRHFYRHDLSFLMGAVQDLVAGMNHCFVSFFQLLSEIKMINDPINDSVWLVGGPKTERVISMVGSYFVKLYSILDILTKIQYELEHIPHTYKEYVTFKSKNVTYKSATRLNIDIAGTLFERDVLISEIESIRNEIVHNGTWANNPKVYVRIENGEIIERYLLYPDMIDGHYTKCKNRHHFFSNDTHLNDRLVYIHFEFLRRMRITLTKMINPNIELQKIIQVISEEDREEIGILFEFFNKADNDLLC